MSSSSILHGAQKKRKKKLFGIMPLDAYYIHTSNSTVCKFKFHATYFHYVIIRLNVCVKILNKVDFHMR